MMDRRDLLKTVTAAGSASVLAAGAAESADQQTPNSKLIDTNISLFQWPFRRLPLDDAERLVSKMRSLGITQGWAGSFEGVLHRDITSVNQRLVEVCKQHKELVPIGSINLELPDWQSDLRRCFQAHNMPGVRLHPNYHGYKLSDSRFADLLEQCASAGRFVQIAVAMEDTRTHHPLVQVADVDLASLPKLMRQFANTNVQLLNHRGRGSAFVELTTMPNVYFDCARVDGTDGIAKLVRTGANERVLFGTHAPFLIPEAALIRTYESNLTEVELRSLMWAAAETI